MSERTERLLAEVTAWRKAHHVTQRELARILDVSPQLITEWKKGRSEPRGDHVLHMIEIMKTHPKKVTPKAGRRAG